MKRFMVRVKEVYYQPVVIEVRNNQNKRDAISKVRAGEGDRTRRKLLSYEMSHRKWEAYEIDKRGRAI
ncbi:MAG: hypothetical protein NWE89_12305 [Candidatus Bathyarchaeota archaeon]|nr:hypothetical protein [Candidatus Bathyarchaeota archaeon]